jgi:beta-galactosidase
MTEPATSTRFTLGVCDYPEHVPPDKWRAYPAQQKALGLSHVRIAEFAWSTLEPRRDQFDFAWLDDAIERLHAAGLGVVMCTPTACPPAWLTKAHPEVLFVDHEGRRRTHGGRRHYDYSSALYLEESQRITEVLARRYGQHPAVIGWQTDNEHGCHNTVRSYSENARVGFQRWLERRYTDVDALNRAWGTVFWSQTYGGFDEVELPNTVVYTVNPSHWLDFCRYSSDQVVAFDRAQTEILRRHSPGRFVTHNFMPFMADFNHYDAAAHLDFPSFDLYPLGVLETSKLSEALKTRYRRSGHPDLGAFNHDLYRGLKESPARGHWVMEHQCGQADWAATNALPTDGAIRLWVWNALAHGADAVTFFRWHAATAAQELMHSGLLHHDGTPDRGFTEVAALAPELPTRPLAPVQAKVALLHDYESLWAYDHQKHGEATGYFTQVMHYYTALRALGVDVDVIHPSRDLSRYALIVAPALHLMSHETAEHLERYTVTGGHLILGARSAFRQPNAQVWAERETHPLWRLGGVRVANFDALRPGVSVALEGVTPEGLRLPENAHAHTWMERLELDSGTRALARYADDLFVGEAAATQRTLGGGAVSYLGAWSEALVRQVLRHRLEVAQVPTFDLPDGVRRSVRGEQVILEDWNTARVRVERVGSAEALVHR